MTPTQKIKWAILAKVAEWNNATLVPITADNVDDLYEQLEEADAHWDAKNEIREGEFETSLPCDQSRHYECKAVAAQMPDGSYVGWDYWFGGGKYGEPEGIEWMDDAYSVECLEEEKMMIVRTFSKIDENKGAEK